MSRRVVVKAPAYEFLRRLAPGPRRALKQALIELRYERGDIRALDENLSGYYRLRVGRYRVVFAYAEDGSIEALFIGERSLVYELFEAEFLKKFGA
jgi:mRNA interferase RelE/StbE